VIRNRNPYRVYKNYTKTQGVKFFGSGGNIYQNIMLIRLDIYKTSE